MIREGQHKKELTEVHFNYYLETGRTDVVSVGLKWYDQAIDEYETADPGDGDDPLDFDVVVVSYEDEGHMEYEYHRIPEDTFIPHDISDNIQAFFWDGLVQRVRNLQGDEEGASMTRFTRTIYQVDTQEEHDWLMEYFSKKGYKDLRTRQDPPKTLITLIQERPPISK